MMLLQKNLFFRDLLDIVAGPGAADKITERDPLKELELLKAELRAKLQPIFKR